MHKAPRLRGALCIRKKRSARGEIGHYIPDLRVGDGGAEGGHGPLAFVHDLGGLIDSDDLLAEDLVKIGRAKRRGILRLLVVADCAALMKQGITALGRGALSRGIVGPPARQQRRRPRRTRPRAKWLHHAQPRKTGISACLTSIVQAEQAAQSIAPAKGRGCVRAAKPRFSG